jgi:general secretion pathway protein D
MTTVFTLRTLLRLFIFSALVLSFQPNSFGQVPVDEVENNPSASEAQAGQALPLENSGFGVLSDPDELSLVDGLDDELERLRLRDQDTMGILEMIQIITGRYILRPQNLPQVKINFDSFTILTKRQTLRVLESLLAMNGIGITKIDDQFFKAVPAANMNVHVPIWLDGPASLIKPNQNIYTKMFYLEHMPVEQMRELLNPFATPNVSTLLTYPKADAILITDSLLNLQRMEKMIEEMDKPANQNMIIFTYRVFGDGESFYKEILLKSFGKEQMLGKEFHLTPEFSLTGNHTIRVVCHKNDEVRLREIIEQLDFEFDLNKESVLIGLRYAKAEEVVTILERLTGGGASSSNRPKPNSNPGAPKPAPTQGGRQKTYSDKSNQFSEYFSVVPDPRTNSVFASGTQNDIKLAKEKVKELDKALPMAQIDTIFVMVTLTGDTSRGIEMFGNALYENTEPGNVAQPDGTSRFSPGGDSLSFSANLPVGGPMTFGFENGKLNSIAWNNIFKIAQTSTDSRVFSSPSIVVSHSQPSAEISMKNKRTVFSESSYNSTTGGQSNFSNNRDFESETTLILTEPRVSLPVLDDNGDVLPGAVHTKLNLITSNFDDLAASTYNGQTIPATQSREVETMITIKDNQIIALGGLQQVKHSRSENQYALLRKIPVLGKSLFTPKSENYEPSELIIFIRSRVFKQDDYSTSTPENSIQSRKIDRMMSENYVPKFKSPTSSGLTTEPIFYEFDTVNSDKTLPVDVPSSKPVF